MKTLSPEIYTDCKTKLQAIKKLENLNLKNVTTKKHCACNGCIFSSYHFGYLCLSLFVTEINEKYDKHFGNCLKGNFIFILK